tara:strand:- start:258 stop:491 length:234 start_codon:yes stop_codon:yes gene_type:complete
MKTKKMSRLNEIKKSKVKITLSVTQAELIRFALERVSRNTNSENKISSSVKEDKANINNACEKLYMVTLQAYQNKNN